EGRGEAAGLVERPVIAIVVAPLVPFGMDVAGLVEDEVAAGVVAFGVEGEVGNVAEDVVVEGFRIVDAGRGGDEVLGQAVGAREGGKGTGPLTLTLSREGRGNTSTLPLPREGRGNTSTLTLSREGRGNTSGALTLALSREGRGETGQPAGDVVGGY